MTLRVSDLQSDIDLDSIRNSCDVWEADAWIAGAAFKVGFVVAVISKEIIPLVEKEK